MPLRPRFIVLVLLIFTWVQPVARAEGGGRVGSVSEARGEGAACRWAHAGVIESAASAPFDADTGEDPREYPPDPQVDFLHIRLDLDFADPFSRSFTGVETLTARTLARPLRELQLHALDLAIERVEDGSGNVLPMRYDGERLTVEFPEPLAPETEFTLVIPYTCSDPDQGMFFALPNEAYADRPLMIHTQGQDDYNRRWFIAHDYPNERCTTEIAATVPAKYRVLSNGALIERAEVGSGRVRYHYRLDQPHPAYLVSLVIGEFAVVTQQWRDIPVEYWVPPDREGDALRTFGTTPDMLEVFSERLGFDYPFAKYAQSVVYLFQWGGMENTSTTTLYETCMIDERAALDEDIEDLIAHELAHQWFGDALTCRTWNHLWLNEGFATYMEMIWHEAAYGPDAYEKEAWRTLRRVARRDDVDRVAGMVSGTGRETYGRRGSDPYSKGSSVLHMLRRSLGDELFWTVIRSYVDRYAWHEVETSDLRREAERLSGRSYERFFEQWVYRGGAPRIRVDYSWESADDGDGGTVKLAFEQTQPLAEAWPAFDVGVEVCLVMPDGSAQSHTASFDQRFGGLTVQCATEPEQVCIDPHASLLAAFDLRIPRPMLVRQALAGPSLASRLEATQALSDHGRPDARDALRTILLDRAAHVALREEAAEALGGMQTDEARDILLAALADRTTLEDPHTRRAAIDALGRYRDPAVVPPLLEYARRDPSYGVEEAATAALGRQEPTEEIIETLLANARKPSRDDDIRQAAVRALADFGDPRGIEPAMELARYGSGYRSRPTGIRALGQLGGDPDHTERVRKFLVAMLDDPQDKAGYAVPRALGALGDDEAIDPLRQYADSAAPERRREAARNAIERIRRDRPRDERIETLERRIAELETAQRELEEKRAREGKADDAAAVRSGEEDEEP